MRISGNYIERLYTFVLPCTLFASLIITLVNKVNFSLGIVFLFVTTLFWVIDTVIILCYRVKSLTFNDGLYFGKELINPNSIVKIVPFETPTGKWQINMLEFTLDDGRKIKILEKPRPIYKELSGKSHSKTLTLLFKYIPKLKSKIRYQSVYQ